MGEQLNLIGLLLTLVSLLGTFFYIHLSTWFSKTMELKLNYEQNKRGNNEEQKQALRDCRFQLLGVYNHVPALVFFVISLFIGVVVVISASYLIPNYAKNDVARSLFWAGCTFTFIYISLSLYFLLRGYKIGRYLDKELNPRNTNDVRKRS